LTVIPESLTFGLQIPTMAVFRKYILLLPVLAFLVSCKHKKPSLSGEEPVEVGDFIDFFQPLKLPYQVADSTLLKKEKDSLLISYKIFTQFVPDSVLGKVFGKGIKPRIYPLGRTDIPKAETYLFVKATTTDKKAVFIISFDARENFMAAMPLLRLDPYVSTTQSSGMDKRFTISKTIVRKNPDGSLSEGKDVYVLNADAKEFMLIMTDPLDDKITELINPIDTLPRKNKLSADYATGKMNLVSIRDGRKNDRISFFIHFEKDKGECTGELKGEAMIKSSSLAEYREGGDPCVLRFSFSSTSVTLNEEEGCGSHRGLRCLFEGSYPRKKYVKPSGINKPSVKK
jgi:hypothetical protein